eukprot:gb/GFBE01024025.1/.p1 GENE.gb/GFBE01024025.1/~~gb/GFBE01024025.1/.p1  ORF type:complete len:100 (+),score=28.42 gb/GFBE01024025.1/:1-300(+)
MSDFVYPRHGCIQELMLKEKAWTAKFIRRQREEEKEAREATAVREKWEQKAEDTIMKFVNSPSKTSSKANLFPGSPPSVRSRTSQPLSVAGEMTVNGIP